MIARMEDGSLLVHSPVEWDPLLGRALANLGGEIKHIISPNYEHLKYAKQWSEKYPQAFMYACPGLRSIKTDVNWSYELFDEQNSQSTLQNNGIDCVYFNCEINPFTGRPFFNEVAFYHKKSKTFFAADVFWNYPSGDSPNYSGSSQDAGNVTGFQHICSKVTTPILPDNGRLPSVPVPIGTKLWKFGMDRIYWPFYQRLMVGKGNERRKRYQLAVEKVLSWDIEVIAPCHGDVIKGRSTCKQAIQTHFCS